MYIIQELTSLAFQVTGLIPSSTKLFPRANERSVGNSFDHFLIIFWGKGERDLKTCKIFVKENLASKEWYTVPN